jgi:(E)-4-hydroxy-3-methylbut-2-enyl-diphosphate synthase
MTYTIQANDQGVVSRRISRQVTIGGRDGRKKVLVGGGAPVSVQSMIKRPTDEVANIIQDCKRLEAAGVDLIRITVPDEETAATMPTILREVTVPIIADIHFSKRAGLASIAAGVDKIRLNPGNMGRAKDVHEIAREAMAAGIPIRIGSNSGSLPKDLLKKYEGDRIPASVEGALRHVELLEECGFHQIVIAIKSSHTEEMIQANRLLALQTDYPIHLGVTEAGTTWEGNIRSAIGIGTILAEGIGDTIRVSLTDDVVEEVKTGIELLKSLGLRQQGITFISCPMCGRLESDILEVAQYLHDRLGHLDKPLRVALMGCPVNGPGEAAGSDLCLLAGKEKGVIYRGEKVVRTIPVQDYNTEMEKEIIALYTELYGPIGGN